MSVLWDGKTQAQCTQNTEKRIVHNFYIVALREWILSPFITCKPVFVNLCSLHFLSTEVCVTWFVLAKQCQVPAPSTVDPSWPLCC